MDWARLLSTTRLQSPARGRAPDDRRELEVDHDRIVFSRSFRRLQDKTQVHPMPDNDHVRRRLTHSVEAGSVGRSLGTAAGKALAKLPDGFDAHDIGSAVQVAALAHDIGNPPFGHSGEDAIRDWFHGSSEVAREAMDGVEEPHRSDLLGFDGNAQGFRVLTRLENYAHEGGMRLCAATLGAFLKYPFGSPVAAARHDAALKFGFFESERVYAEQVAEHTGMLEHAHGGHVRHPLAWLVEAADDICYALADIEDGVELGVLEFEEVATLLHRFVPEGAGYDDARDEGRRLQMLRSYTVRAVLPPLARTFAARERELLRGELEAELLDLVEEGSAIRQAQELAQRKVFSHPKKVYTEIGAYQVVVTLFDAFVRAALDREAHVLHGRRMPSRSEATLRLIGSDAPQANTPRHEALRMITDYVAGMTDRFASRLVTQLRGGA